MFILFADPFIHLSIKMILYFMGRIGLQYYNLFSDEASASILYKHKKYTTRNNNNCCFSTFSLLFMRLWHWHMISMLIRLFYVYKSSPRLLLKLFIVAYVERPKDSEKKNILALLSLCYVYRIVCSQSNNQIIYYIKLSYWLHVQSLVHRSRSENIWESVLNFKYNKQRDRNQIQFSIFKTK